MERQALVLLLTILVAVANPVAGQEAARLTGLENRLLGAAIAVTARWKNGQEMEGLGLIIGRAGGKLYVATAAHVLGGRLPDEVAQTILVRNPADPGRLVEADPQFLRSRDVDLAVFSVAAPAGWHFKPNVLAPPRPEPERGDRVWTLQPNPATGWQLNPESGLIKEFVPSRREWRLVQLPVRRGVSGAPLVTAQGVIGIVVSDADEAGATALDVKLVEDEVARLGLPWQLSDRPEATVEIRGGEVRLGATEEDLQKLSLLRSDQDWRAAYDSARPARTFTLSGFEIDATEVSWKAFLAWLAETGRPNPVPERMLQYRSSNSDPVFGVTWGEADAYCRAQGKRLPTEAEWERAARGTSGRVFPWGDGPPTEAVSCADCGEEEAGRGPNAVGSAAGDLTLEGVWDLGGNVREWVQDWYSSDAYATAVPRDPERTTPGETRVVRGGSWFDPLHDLAAFRRNAERPDRRDPRMGFRCARRLTDP